LYVFLDESFSGNDHPTKWFVIGFGNTTTAKKARDNCLVFDSDKTFRSTNISLLAILKFRPEVGSGIVFLGKTGAEHRTRQPHPDHGCGNGYRYDCGVEESSLLQPQWFLSL
jgi:hypothetical protein